MTIAEITQSLAENPGDWETRLQLVQALMAEARHDEAVAVVNEGEAIPHEAEAWLAAAKTYAAVGAYEQAGTLVATSLEIDPDYTPAQEFWNELAETAQSYADGELAEGEDRQKPGSAAAPLIRRAEGSDAEPFQLPKVTYASHELEALQAAEEEVRERRERATRRDKFNSLTITVLIHVALFLGLTFVATQEAPRVPPSIVASSAPANNSEVPELNNVKMQQTTAGAVTNTADVDIISVNASSAFSVTNVEAPPTDMAAEAAAEGSRAAMSGMGGIGFNPSVSLGASTSTTSKMMFGQTMEMKGDVLGVILDVSGSMAEFLPVVIREIDKNFENSPIVYVKNTLMSKSNREGEVRLIRPEDVVPFHPELKTHTPYWFLWYDLPRKAPQRYVDRLIETFKTRPNQFLTTGKGWDGSSISVAVDFLIEQNMDGLYIFSDFEDYADEDIAAELGQKLGRRRIRTYLQPAEKGSDFLNTLTKKIANKTLGRQLPSLVSLIRGNEADDEVTSLTKDNKKADLEALAKMNVKLATPRDTTEGSNGAHGYKIPGGLTEIHRLSEPEYDAVFYGPQARADIFLKDAEGKYIQNPISFFYHAWKEIPDHPDPRYRWRARKFLRMAEDPSFDGKEIIWKMILEDEIKFNVHLYLGRKGMNATYTADAPKDNNDASWIGFRVPSLATESKDKYYGYDFPAEGLTLTQVREAVKTNEVIFNLPRQERDRLKKSWAISGFDMGYNTRKYDDMIRAYPSGIRDLVVQGESFGPRKFHARTTSSKILLSGGAGRPDSEPWEGFWASLNRSRAVREKFTKTEAIEISIE